MAIPQVKSLPGCCHQVHRFRFLSQGKVTPWTARTRPAPAELHWGLQEALDARDLSFGVPVHALLVKAPAHFAGSLSLWNKLLNLYGRCGQNRTTMRLLFDEMRERDVVTFNTMISSCLRSGDNREVARAPNNITLSMLLAASSCSPAPLCLVEQIHAQSVKMELAGDGFVGVLEQANRVFDRMDQVDAVGWNILIDSCARSGTAERTVEIFSRMRRQDGENETIDGFSLTSVLKTCSEPKYLRLGTQIHACAFKAGFSSETPIGNALITMYSKCQKCKESMAAFLHGHAENGFCGERIFFRQRASSFQWPRKPSERKANSCRVAKSAHGFDVAVGNALVDMYFKCGSLEDGQRVFRTMTNHDVVSWTAMIGGLGQHGKAREALEVLQEMVAGGYKPDSVTFLAGLSACSHGGLVNDGFKIFHSMTSIYRIKPMKEHYASLIDLLGRAGKLEDAARFIAEMGLDSDPLAWETFLKIMELEPQKEGAYVMLSNIYAEKRMWEQKGILRHTLDATGLKKDVGYSWSTVVESYTT
ncbi:unnamed protein product [Spirodela intermedia]|uniref:Uncharacterized protein n=1 Tax=Spirodela intermedia TaxID=51605 RepID=A0A7I8J629_SPIIN|nr:unnamed protein product [Spirodela intermedia]CAA6665708.1 unnamed protein product [Spirodela intermedia]